MAGDTLSALPLSPAPWKWGPRGEISAADGSHICDVVPADVSEGQWVSNARLIVGSPELLLAAEQAYGTMRCKETPDLVAPASGCFCDCCKAAFALETAILRVRGL